MDYRNLGRTGLKVSALCLGTMQFGWTADEDTSYQILNEAFNSGINFIDTADIYSNWADDNSGGISETIIGRWLKKSNIPRDQVIIGTKVRGRMGDGPNDQGLSRAHILNAVEASLNRLGTDYIDLYQTHWYDNDVPIEETLTTLDDLIRQGKVRYIGASNYPVWRLMRALWTSDMHGLARYKSLQPHYNLIRREEFERELMEVCQLYGIGVIPYSPLAGGFLTGKYRPDTPLPDSNRVDGTQNRYFNDRSWAILESVDQVANGRDISVSQAALAWHLSNPAVTSPIIGPRTLAQLADNLGAADLRLTEDEMDILNHASEFSE
jgi:aryl-alcohol dehydrogenase-like predicted oxidoreductase